MATLTVTINERLLLNNNDYSSNNKLSVTGVSEVVKRIVNIGTDEIGLLGFGTAYNTELSKTYVAGQFDDDDVRYIRVTNLDDTTSVTLSLQSDAGEDDSAADESASLLLEAGKSFMMGTPNDGIGISDANSNLVTDLVDLESLVIFTGSDAIDVEIFVASA